MFVIFHDFETGKQIVLPENVFYDLQSITQLENGSKIILKYFLPTTCENLFYCVKETPIEILEYLQKSRKSNQCVQESPTTSGIYDYCVRTKN